MKIFFILVIRENYTFLTNTDLTSTDTLRNDKVNSETHKLISLYLKKCTKFLHFIYMYTNIRLE